MEELSLIDVSGEDDLLFGLASPPPAATPPRHPGPPRAGSLEAAAAGSSAAAPGRTADPDGAVELQEAPERAESPKQRKAKTGVNLRKSLAWDSAFFTSEGVLDTEELAIVNSTYRKTQGSRLPGIVEEMRRSGESTTSTLENETWAMESLETELFDNVRASIQRSLGKPDRVPGGSAGSSKPPKVTANVPRVAVRKVVDRMPKIRPPVSTSQGVGGGKQRPQVTSKEPTAARVALPAAAESKPSSKPPRALPRVATMRSSTNTAVTSGISDKRSSTGGVVSRQAVGKATNISASLRPAGVTRSSAIYKSSTLTSMDNKPDAKSKSATLSNKNRIAQRVPVRSSSRSDISRTNPARSTGNKIPARGHSDRASPTISPSSSIDSMSSVISGASTASTVGKMSHTSEGSSTLSCTLSPSLRKSSDLPQTTQLKPPVAAEGPSSGTAGFKPSGLRRPTPKIGYFDAEKSIDKNIGAQLQPQPVTIQCLLSATPRSQPSPSTRNIDMASSTFGQQETKCTAAAHEENNALKSEAAKVVPHKVAQREMEPIEMADSEVFKHQTDPVVAEPEAEKSFDQNVGAQAQLQEIQCLHPATPNFHSSVIGQQESKPIAVPHEINCCKSKAEKVITPLKAAQMGGEHLKMVDPEGCTLLTDPVVAADTPKENIPTLHQNIQADANSLVDLLTQKLSSISLGEAAPDLAS